MTPPCHRLVNPQICAALKVTELYKFCQQRRSRDGQSRQLVDRYLPALCFDGLKPRKHVVPKGLVWKLLIYSERPQYYGGTTCPRKINLAPAINNCSAVSLDSVHQHCQVVRELPPEYYHDLPRTGHRYLPCREAARSCPSSVQAYSRQ